MIDSETHYHTHDLVNDQRYVHTGRVELERYLDMTGREQMRIRSCTTPTCVAEAEEEDDLRR